MHLYPALEACSIGMAAARASRVNSHVSQRPYVSATHATLGSIAAGTAPERITAQVPAGGAAWGNYMSGNPSGRQQSVHPRQVMLDCGQLAVAASIRPYSVGPFMHRGYRASPTRRPTRSQSGTPVHGIIAHMHAWHGCRLPSPEQLAQSLTGQRSLRMQCMLARITTEPTLPPFRSVLQPRSLHGRSPAACRAAMAARDSPGNGSSTF